jgi:MarR family transcriptional regulator for hemolysin
MAVLRYDFENSVGYWICMTSHAFRRTLSARLAEEGITLRQWEVLAWLACDGEVSQSELAECLGIEPHTLAGVVRRMERDGWLRRTSCADDRRRNRLVPTERGEEVWRRALQHCHAIREQAVAGFTPAELSLLKKLCAEIRANLAVPDHPCQPCAAEAQGAAALQGDSATPTTSRKKTSAARRAPQPTNAAALP